MNADKFLIIFLILVALITFSFSFFDYSLKNPVSVAAWNLNVFGDAKANNESLMNQYKGIISEFDIIFLQEIRDIDGSAMKILCDGLNNSYNCINSSRAGNSSYKEQYLLIYDKKFELLDFTDYNLLNVSGFIRPPIKAIFNYNNTSFAIYGIHVQPSNAANEISNLENLVVNEGNVAVLGDLNADCAYYTIGDDFSDWSWTINEDTTVSSSDCIYDQIIVNRDFDKYFINSAVYIENITKTLSDHYLIYSIFDLG